MGIYGPLISLELALNRSFFSILPKYMFSFDLVSDHQVNLRVWTKVFEGKSGQKCFWTIWSFLCLSCSPERHRKRNEEGTGRGRGWALSHPIETNFVFNSCNVFKTVCGLGVGWDCQICSSNTFLQHHRKCQDRADILAARKADLMTVILSWATYRNQDCSFNRKNSEAKLFFWDNPSPVNLFWVALFPPALVWYLGLEMQYKCSSYYCPFQIILSFMSYLLWVHFMSIDYTHMQSRLPSHFQSLSPYSSKTLGPSILLLSNTTLVIAVDDFSIYIGFFSNV